MLMTTDTVDKQKVSNTKGKAIGLYIDIYIYVYRYILCLQSQQVKCNIHKSINNKNTICL